MKIKLRELLDAQPALVRLFSEARPPAKLAYKLGMMQRALAPHLEEYGKAQTALLKKHDAKPIVSEAQQTRWAFLDAEGKPDIEKAQQYAAEWEDLVSLSIDVGDLRITLNDIDCCNMEKPISPAEMASIWWLVEDKEETE